MGGLAVKKLKTIKNRGKRCHSKREFFAPGDMGRTSGGKGVLLETKWSDADVAGEPERFYQVSLEEASSGVERKGVAALRNEGGRQMGNIHHDTATGNNP